MIEICRICGHGSDVHWSQDAFGFKGRGCAANALSCKCAGFESRYLISGSVEVP